MNIHPHPHSGSYVARVVLTAMILLTLTTKATWAQSPSPQPRPTDQSAQAGALSQPAAQTAPAAPDGDLAQMRTDLDRMESLLGNMSSEIEFLRDQNLQILLRTNAQMWIILIRDLRRQVDREERRRDHK